MKNRKYIVAILSIIIVFIAGGAFWTAYNLEPGSDPNAQKYYLNSSIDRVKEAIVKFKQANPEYMVPEVTIKGQGALTLFDGRKEDNPDRDYIYFYYKAESQIVFTWLGGGNEKTVFALISVNDGLDLGHWKDVNKDFSEEKNDRQKHLFEERILNKIKAELQIMK